MKISADVLLESVKDGEGPHVHRRGSNALLTTSNPLFGSESTNLNRVPQPSVLLIQFIIHLNKILQTPQIKHKLKLPSAQD